MVLLNQQAKGDENNSTCPLCDAEDKIVSHFLGLCLMVGKLIAQLLDTYYTTPSDTLLAFI